MIRWPWRRRRSALPQRLRNRVLRIELTVDGLACIDIPHTLALYQLDFACGGPTEHVFKVNETLVTLTLSEVDP